MQENTQRLLSLLHKIKISTGLQENTQRLLSLLHKIKISTGLQENTQRLLPLLHKNHDFYRITRCYNKYIYKKGEGNRGLDNLYVCV